jgi:hypothetical protein
MLSAVAHCSLWPTDLPSQVPQKHCLDWVAQPPEGKEKKKKPINSADQEPLLELLGMSL